MRQGKQNVFHILTVTAITFTRTFSKMFVECPCKHLSFSEIQAKLIILLILPNLSNFPAKFAKYCQT